MRTPVDALWSGEYKQAVNTFRIVVLSDQHIDTSAEPRSWDRARAAFQAAIDEDADHVVLAGDTFDCATAMVRDAPRVRRYLRRLRLWHRDRLTIVPGNHDLFHTPHYGNVVAKFSRGAVPMLTTSVHETYGAFCDWVDDLIAWRDVLDRDNYDYYPHHKGR